MHNAVKVALERWASSIPRLTELKVADLGAQNINGSVKDVIPHAVGFDVKAGEGVDVVIEEGMIPEQWQHHFHIVVSISTLQFSSDPHKFVHELFMLLKPRGEVFVTICHSSCHAIHSGGDDVWRFSEDGLMKLFAADFIGYVTETGDEKHRDLIFIGHRR